MDTLVKLFIGAVGGAILLGSYMVWSVPSTRKERFENDVAIAASCLVRDCGLREGDLTVRQRDALLQQIRETLVSDFGCGRLSECDRWTIARALGLNLIPVEQRVARHWR